MKPQREDGTVRMKLIIARDELPELYRELARISDPRHRTGRLRDLATKGLMLESTRGAQAMPVAQPATTGRSTSADSGDGVVPQRSRTSVDSMLEWDAPAK